MTVFINAITEPLIFFSLVGFAGLVAVLALITDTDPKDDGMSMGEI